MVITELVFPFSLCGKVAVWNFSQCWNCNYHQCMVLVSSPSPWKGVAFFPFAANTGLQVLLAVRFRIWMRLYTTLELRCKQLACSSLGNEETRWPVIPSPTCYKPRGGFWAVVWFSAFELVGSVAQPVRWVCSLCLTARYCILFWGASPWVNWPLNELGCAPHSSAYVLDPHIPQSPIYRCCHGCYGCQVFSAGTEERSDTPLPTTTLESSCRKSKLIEGIFAYSEEMDLFLGLFFLFSSLPVLVFRIKQLATRKPRNVCTSFTMN